MREAFNFKNFKLKLTRTLQLKRDEPPTSKSTSFVPIDSNAIDPIVDIVFVHGFGGHCTNTWTSEGICWPRKFLRPKLERARIAFFGYEADLSKFLPQRDESNSMSEYAAEMLRYLTSWRTDEGARNRALIFVAHSIGSIVVKEALCCLSSESIAVAEACRGVIFLGAPHRETGKASLGQIAAKAAIAVQPSLTNEAIRELEVNSGLFDRVNDAFVEYLQRREGTFKAITFYEEVEAAVPILHEVVVERESAIVDNRHHHLRGLKADHSNMTKVVRLDDPNYVAISGVIVRIYEDIQPLRMDCEVLFNSPNPLLDIVFIHSLGGDNTTSWSFGKTYWPKAHLPADLPYARIIACNYQTDFIAFTKPQQAVMNDLATECLLSLLRVRDGTSSSDHARPILFVAHSIGGTLVKQVLNISYLARDPNLHSISLATRGILFFGTPHQGDGSRSIGTIATKVILSAFPNIGRNVENAIKNDFAFEEINRTFLDYLEKQSVKQDTIHLLSFYPQRNSRLHPIFTRVSVALPSQRVARLPSSHVELGRFSERNSYLDVVKQICDIAEQQAAMGKGCNIVHDPAHAQMDIVFVPGLRAGAILAWSHERLCWPRDLLPHDLPDARIIIYGYNADSSDFFRMEGANSIFLCSRELLSNLNELRVGSASNRPLMFIAHSCGGFLVKDAFVQSHREHDRGKSDIAACLQGIIFLGTPHDQHVSDSAALLKFVENLYHLGQSLSTQLDVKETAKVIRHVTTSFKKICSTERTDILLRMFFEEAPMPNIGVIVDRLNGDPRYEVNSLPTRHTSLPKVKSRDCEEYKRVLKAAQDIYSHSKRSVASNQTLETQDRFTNTEKLISLHPENLEPPGELIDIRDMITPITAHEHAKCVSPDGHADQPAGLNDGNLSFKVAGELADTNEVVTVHKHVLDLAITTCAQPGLDTWLCRCWEYLSSAIPLLAQDHNFQNQANFDVRLRMWRPCHSSESPTPVNDFNIHLKIRELREFLGFEAFEADETVVATLVQRDLRQISEYLSSVIDRNMDAIVSLDEDSLLLAMDIIQTLVDAKCAYYAKFQRALLRTSRKRKLLPSYLHLSDVRRLNVYPLVGGGFADVYRGTYFGQIVALKVLRIGCSKGPVVNSDEEVKFPEVGDQEGEDFVKLHMPFCKEAMIWRQLDHRNILPLYGISQEVMPPRFCLVSPWMVNGDLVAYLKSHDQVDRLWMITMISEGLEYLHSFGDGIVHGDFRGANILIDELGNPRIADFGLTQIIVKNDSTSSLASFGGNLNWLSPELLLFDIDNDPIQQGYAKESDVYSFACVCMEVFTGRPPFYGFRPVAIITAAMTKAKPRRPEDLVIVLKGLDDPMWQIMLLCWETEPASRPSMSEVSALLHRKKGI